jgi:heterodisulfide reductase subunit B
VKMVQSEMISCQLCGEEVDARSIVKHMIVPKEIMEQARMRRARIIRMCPKCSAEVQNWYKAKIAKTTYDTQIKKFRQRLPAEMVKEYEGTYNRFARFKKNQQQLV